MPPQESQTPQVQPNIQNPAPVKKSTSKGTLIIAIVLTALIFSALGAVGYWFFTKDNATEIGDGTTTTVTTTTTKTVTSEGDNADLYEGWKTYENTEWGISFKYTGSGKTVETHNNLDNSDPEVSKIGYAVNSEDYGKEIMWGVWENPENLTLDEFFEEYLSSMVETCTIDNNFTIDSKTTIKAVCNMPQAVSHTTIYLIDSQGRIFDVKYNHYMEEEYMNLADLSIETIEVK